MRYAMEAGGKRLRPVCLLAASDLFERAHDPLPAAVAMGRTYTLMHDDLPSIDDSDLRRGAPATFNSTRRQPSRPAMPYLCILVVGERLPHTRPRNRTHRHRRAAGSERLIGGQQEDIDNEAPGRGPPCALSTRIRRLHC